MWSVSDSHYTVLVFETWWVGEGSFVSTDLAYLCSLFVLLTSDQCLTQLPWNQLPLLVNLKKIKLALLCLCLVLGNVPTPDSACSDRLVRFFRIGDSDLHLFLELLYTHLFLKFERHLECLYGINSDLKHLCKDTLILSVYMWPWRRLIGKEIDCCSVENLLAVDYRTTIKSSRPVKQVSTKLAFRFSIPNARTVIFLKIIPMNRYLGRWSP
jgi:hypothetical protein